MLFISQQSIEIYMLTRRAYRSCFTISFYAMFKKRNTLKYGVVMSRKDLLRKEWILSRKKLINEVKSHVNKRTGALDGELSESLAKYKSQFENGWGVSSRDELVQKINQASIVLGADFHAYSQSQKSHLRLIRQILKRKSVIIALECFGFEDQDAINQFQQGQLSEDDFLIKTSWDEQWGFPWATYRMIFKYARENNIEVRAINHHSEDPNELNSFDAREHKVVEALQSWRVQNPDSLIYVLFGELHLSESYLPQKIKQALGADPLVILQNSEELYFQLAAKSLENKVDIMSKGNNYYCLMESPPWVKWQSYLMYLEETYDFDLDEDEEEIIVDHTDTIAKFVELVASDIGLALPWEDVDDLAVYGADKDELWEIFEDAGLGTHKDIIDYFIKAEKSFHFPKLSVSFLSRSTVNHAAEVAGHYLQSRLSERVEPLWDMPNDFYPNIYLEALGFFASKIVNHRRKAESLEEIRIRLSQMRPENAGREALLLVLDYRLTEVIWLNEGRERNKKFKPKKKGDYFFAARIIGQMLGERLYACFSDKTITSEEILVIFKQDICNNSFTEKYFDMIKMINGRIKGAATK